MAHFGVFLGDHANCERKASAQAMSFVVKYPNREKILAPLIELAQEELDHFRRIYEVMAARNLPLIRDVTSPYIKRLMECMRHGRNERFLDRLVMGSLLAERGQVLGKAEAEILQDEPIRPALY